MKIQPAKLILWFHTLVTALAGLGIYLFPKTYGPLWPWALPPLAARFMGSLLIGGAVCTALTAFSPKPLPLAGPALLGLGDFMIASVGLLNLGESGFTARMAIWLVVFIGMAILLWILLLLRRPQINQGNDSRSLPRSLRRYFKIHLAVVIPVGLTMYLAPGLAQQLWPWSLSPVNVRMLGAFFIGASFLSVWCLRQRDWQVVRPLVGLYAVFTTLTTLASVIHFSLFNPGRVVTWAFFALYLFVALGAWYFLVINLRRQSQAVGAPMDTPLIH